MSRDRGRIFVVHPLGACNLRSDRVDLLILSLHHTSLLVLFGPPPRQRIKLRNVCHATIKIAKFVYARLRSTSITLLITAYAARSSLRRLSINYLCLLFRHEPVWPSILRKQPPMLQPCLQFITASSVVYKLRNGYLKPRRPVHSVLCCTFSFPGHPSKPPWFRSQPLSCRDENGIFAPSITICCLRLEFLEARSC
jgi:hypothetical protein